MKKTLLVLTTAAGLLLAATNASAQFVAGQNPCPRYGTPQQGQGPKDGTGYGAQSNNKSGKRTGPKDGAGQKHQQGRRGGRG